MELKRQLGLFTAVCVIVGDMIGTGIFATTGDALADVGSAALVLGLSSPSRERSPMPSSHRSGLKQVVSMSISKTFLENSRPL